MSTIALVISVVVTLLVYWIAEQYAEALGEHTTGGHLPSRASIQGAPISTWPMVTRAAAAAGGGGGQGGRGVGAHGRDVGLMAAIAPLTVHGWLAGRAAQLQDWKLLWVTSIAAALGLVMILLKDLVLIHLH